MNVPPTELSDALLVAPEIVDRRPFDAETADRRRRIVHGRPEHVDWAQFCNFVAGRWRTSGWPYLGPQAGILEWMTQAHSPQSVPLGQAMAALGGAGFDEGRQDLEFGHRPGVRALATLAESNPEALERLAFDPCVVVRTAAAMSPYTPERALERLADDPFRPVRIMVKRNRTTPEFVVQRLFDDRDLSMPSEACSCAQGSPIDFSDTLGESGLRLPEFLPDHLMSQLQSFGDWRWGTQPLPSPIDDYMLASVDYLNGPVPDQLAISHAGHGANSFSLNLRLVAGPLAVLVQVAWGGLYGDRNEQTKRWNDCMHDLGAVLEKVHVKRVHGYVQRPLLLIVSDFRFNDSSIRVEQHGESGWVAGPNLDNWSDVEQLVQELRDRTYGGPSDDRSFGNIYTAHVQVPGKGVVALVNWERPVDTAERTDGVWVPLEDPEALDGTLVVRGTDDLLDAYDQAELDGRDLTLSEVDLYDLGLDAF